MKVRNCARCSKTLPPDKPGALCEGCRRSLHSTRNWAKAHASMLITQGERHRNPEARQKRAIQRQAQAAKMRGVPGPKRQLGPMHRYKEPGMPRIAWLERPMPAGWE